MSGITQPLIAKSSEESISASKNSDSKSSTKPLDEVFPDLLNHLKISNSKAIQFSATPVIVVEYFAGAIVGLEQGELFLVSQEGEKIPLGSHSAGISVILVRESLAITASDDGTIKVWDLNAQKEVEKVTSHEGGVTAVEFLPDGSRFITAGGDYTAKLWSLSPLTEIHKFEGHSDSVTALCVTRDGKIAITGSNDKSVKVWDIDERKELATMWGHAGEIADLKVTASGKLVASGDSSGYVKVWSLETFKEAGAIGAGEYRVRSISITPDDKRLLFTGDRCSVGVWSLETFTEVIRFYGHNWGSYYCKALDNRFAISSSGDKTVRIYDLQNLTNYGLLQGHTAAVFRAAMSEDHERLYSVAGDKSLRIWKLDLDKNVQLTHNGSVTCLAVSHAKNLLASGSVDNTIKVWDLASMKVLFTLQGHESTITALCFSFDGKLLMSGSNEGQIRLWDASSSQELAFLQEHTSKITAIAASTDGKLFFSGAEDGYLYVWSVEERKKVGSLEGHSDAINRIIASPDGKHLLSASSDCLEILWDVHTFKQIKCESHSGSVYAADADLHYLVSGDSERYVYVRVLSFLRHVAKLDAQTNSIRCVAIIPGQKKCVAGCASGYIHVWNLMNLKREAKINAHDKGVYHIIAFPNGKFFASESSDLSVKVWSVESYREVAVFRGHTNYITELLITPDCNFVITSAEDGSIRRHDVSAISDLPEIDLDDYKSITGNHLTGHYVGELIKGNTEKLAAAYRTVLPYRFNALHIFAFFNFSNSIKQFLNEKVPIVNGVFGSPLSIAIRRNTRKCIDEIVAFVNELLEKNESWLVVQFITDDIPDLIQRKSPYILKFFEKVIRTSSQGNLPQQIVPVSDLPMVEFASDWRVPCERFAVMKGDEFVTSGSQVIEFKVTEFRWNLELGSTSSLAFLTSCEETEDTELLKTLLVQNIVQHKWNALWSVTFLHTLVYTVMLLVLMALTFHYGDQYTLQIVFIGINAALLLYEVLQMITTGFIDYWKDPWNYIDISRNAVSLYFGATFDVEWHLLVVGLCFFRGFTFFRTFKMTRMFVRLTLDVVKEMYSFLLILAYSTLSFGMMYAALNPLEITTAYDAWTTAYKLLMGDFSTDGFGSIQWACFTAASLVNIIIMLNLLISILGDAYGKAQDSSLVNDTLAQLRLIIEYESLMFWRRNFGEAKVLIICCEDEPEEEDEDMSAITKEFQKATERDVKSSEKLTSIDGRMATMEGKVAAIEKKMDLAFGEITETLKKLRE